ncbi:MAG: hypothetical protein FD149_476 [Rhodospirillaceae bacterium]|nr:MAG: hypothetical protein FD149_476 [Rhodospirillaceae bacterium]
MVSDKGNDLHAMIAAEPEGSAVLVPGGAWVLAARFSREGDDLLLMGPEGQRVLIRDYFTTENPPALRTDTGASLSGALVVKLAGPLAPGQYAQAGGAAAAGVADVSAGIGRAR